MQRQKGAAQSALKVGSLQGERAGSSHRSSKLTSLLVATLLGSFASSAPVLATGGAEGKLAAATRFDIPAQSLSASLRQLADQAGIQILFDERIVRGIKAPAVNARQSALQALNTLLSNTDLEFAAKDETVAVRRKSSAPTAGSLTPDDGATQDKRSVRLAQAMQSEAAPESGAASPGATAEKVDDSAPEEVLVQGQKLEETLPMELSNYGNRIQVIDSDTIQRLGMVDVTEVMASLGKSLVIIPRGGAFDYSEVSLLGSRTVDVLWLVDGVRVSNRLYNEFTQLDTIPAHMIERVEVLEGGQSLFYGTMAIGGVVNIVTKSFADRTSGAISAGTDSRGARSFSAHLRGSAAGKHRYVLYASSDEAEGNLPYRKADMEPSATDRHRGYDYSVFGLKYSYDFSEAARISLGYQHANGKQDYPYPYLASEIYNTRSQDFASLKFDYEVSDALAFYLKGYYHKWVSHYTQINNSLANPGTFDIIYYDVPWWFKDYGVNALAKFSLHKGAEYYLGYDLQNYSGEDQVIDIAHLTETVHSVFAQVRSTPQFLEKARLSAGVRVNKPEESGTQAIWNVSGQYDITDSLYVRANAGTAFRLPSAFELFSVDPCCKGNPALEAEKSRNYNVSVGAMFGNGARPSTLEVVGFYREVDNLVSYVDNPVLGVLEFQNTPNTVRFSGFQLSSRIALSDALSANATYMFTSSKDPATDLQIDHVPRQTAKASFEYVPSQRRFGGAMTYNYVGKTYMTVSTFGRQPYGDYGTLDLSAFFDLDADRKHRITLRLLNAFDTEQVTRLRRGYRDADGSPYLSHYIGAPRTIQAKYSFNF